MVWRGLRHSVPGLDLNDEVAKPILDRGLSKADVIAKLPDELIALSWSCRGPIFEDGTPHPCGTCPACVLRSSALRKAADQKGDSKAENVPD